MASDAQHEMALLFSPYKAMIFITGAAILGLEVIASRVLNPYFGVSLYIWSSILATTLAFLAIGYAMGGVLTRRWPVTRILAVFHLFPVLASLGVMAAVVIYPRLFYQLADWDLLLGCFVGATVLMGLPLILLSALNPLMVPLIDVPAHAAITDSGAGHVYFISTIGSVAGVLFAAFAIIPYVTNRQAMLSIAIILALTALAGALANKSLADRPRTIVCSLSAMAILGVALLWT